MLISKMCHYGKACSLPCLLSCQRGTNKSTQANNNRPRNRNTCRHDHELSNTTRSYPQAENLRGKLSGVTYSFHSFVVFVVNDKIAHVVRFRAPTAHVVPVSPASPTTTAPNSRPRSCSCSLASARQASTAAVAAVAVVACAWVGLVELVQLGSAVVLGLLLVNDAKRNVEPPVVVGPVGCKHGAHGLSSALTFELFRGISAAHVDGSSRV